MSDAAEGATPGPRRSMRSLVAIMAGSVVLLVAGLGSSSSLGAISHDRPLAPVTPRTEAVTPTGATPRASSSMSMFPRSDGRPAPSWIGHMVIAAAVIAVVVLVGVFLLRLVQHLKRVKPLPEATAAEATAGEVLADETLQAITESLDEALRRLRIGDDVDAAIVECWWRLEAAAADSGVVRQPTQTAEEFTVAVLEATPARADDLRGLADLYRRAMFSGTGAGAVDRDRAVSALENLLAALASRRPASTSGQATQRAASVDMEDPA